MSAASSTAHMLRLWQKHRYTPLQAAGHVETKRVSRFKTALVVGGFLVWTWLVGFASLRAGRSATMEPSGLHQALELAPVYRTFTYNRTYAEAPSRAITNSAWAAMFPLGGTFFTHPKIAPNISTFSVYHQLHCIDAIRQGYWAVVEAGAQGKALSEADIPAMATPPHIRHCLDLLRQSVMCHADTTLEVLDPRVKGVHGFGVEHRCRDWGQLVHWTEQWNDIPPEEDV